MFHLFIFPSLFHIGLRPIKHNKQSFMNQNQTYPYSIGSCTKISRHRQLNAWRMEITTVQETFSCKTTFFKIDQLIAENPKSSKQALTFLTSTYPGAKCTKET